MNLAIFVNNLDDKIKEFAKHNNYNINDRI